MRSGVILPIIGGRHDRHHHHRPDQKADQGDDRHGAQACVVEMMHEGFGAEAPGLADHAPERGRDFAEKGGELDGVARVAVIGGGATGVSVAFSPTSS